LSGYNPNRNRGRSDLSNTAADLSSVENKGFFSKLLRSFSTYGMIYDDMVVKNAVGINVHEDPHATPEATGMYDFFSRKATAMLSERQSVAYNTRDYADKRAILRQYALKDEIRSCVSRIADTAIVYREEDKRFCNISSLGNEFEANVPAKLQEVFNRIYTMFRFDDGVTAWRYYRNFMVDGYLCFEIVYDDWQKNVVGFNQLDVTTIAPAIDEDTRTMVWVQYPENPSIRRVLLDSQIIYMAYSPDGDNSETSYVEPLIRPYNQLKLLEHTKLQFNLQQAMMHKQITVPVKGLPPARAQQEIAQLIADYHDEISWDDVMGTVTFDGRQNIPWSKEHWFPEGEHGTPKVEIIDPGGHNLNEDNMLTWFFNTFKRASKLPFTRFDHDSGGGNIYASAGDLTHEDEHYQLFINRTRAIFREILLKPIYIQMRLEFPELKKNTAFKQRLSLDYYGNDKYEKWSHLNDMQKRSEVLGALNSTLMRDKDVPWLHPKMAVKHIMDFSDEFIDENERYHLEDKSSATKTDGGGMDGPAGGGAGGTDSGAPLGDAGDLGDDATGAQTDTGGDTLSDLAQDTAQPGGDTGSGGPDDTGGIDA
jgi:hypothetical protein